MLRSGVRPPSPPPMQQAETLFEGVSAFCLYSRTLFSDNVSICVREVAVMGTKQCTRCGEVKDETPFSTKINRGKVTRRATCKECYEGRQPALLFAALPAGRSCTRCGEWKELAKFHKHRIGRYGVEPICKVCKAEKRRERDALNPEKARSVDLKAKYGITLADYEAMFAWQGGRCAICGADDQKLVVDHNHTTRKVRSLLCHLCNALIGCAREDIDILVSVAAYLHAELNPELPAVRAAITFHPVSAPAATGMPEDALDVPISFAGVLAP